MILTGEESKEQLDYAVPAMMNLENYKAILSKAKANLDFSRVDFKKKHKNPAPQAEHDFVT